MKNIFVNGIMIDEFLRDNESLEDEIKGREHNQEIQSEYTPYHQPRLIYKSKKERNGKVRILSQIEKNIVEYETRIVKYLEKEDYYPAYIVIIMCRIGIFWNVNSITDEMDAICEKHGLGLSHKVRHMNRLHLARVKKSAFLEYVELLERNTVGNANNFAIIRLDAEKAKDLSIDKALELAYKNILPSVRALTPTKKEIKKMKPTKKSLPEIKVPIPEANQVSLIDSIVKTLQNLKGNGAVVNIQGDLHVHINVQK